MVTVGEPVNAVAAAEAVAGAIAVTVVGTAAVAGAAAIAGVDPVAVAVAVVGVSAKSGGESSVKRLALQSHVTTSDSEMRIVGATRQAVPKTDDA